MFGDRRRRKPGPVGCTGLGGDGIAAGAANGTESAGGVSVSTIFEAEAIDPFNLPD